MRGLSGRPRRSTNKARCIRRRNLGAHAQPGVQCLARERADRHHARLVALAQHAHRVVGEIDVVDLQPRELGQAQAGRIEQLEHGAIAHGQRLIARLSVTSCAASSGDNALGSVFADFGARMP